MMPRPSASARRPRRPARGGDGPRWASSAEGSTAEPGDKLARRPPRPRRPARPRPGTRPRARARSRRGCPSSRSAARRRVTVAVARAPQASTWARDSLSGRGAQAALPARSARSTASSRRLPSRRGSRGVEYSQRARGQGPLTRRQHGIEHRIAGQRVAEAEGRAVHAHQQLLDRELQRLRHQVRARAAYVGQQLPVEVAAEDGRGPDHRALRGAEPGQPLTDRLGERVRQPRRGQQVFHQQRHPFGRGLHPARGSGRASGTRPEPCRPCPRR